MKRVLITMIVVIFAVTMIFAQKTQVIFWEAMEAKLGTTLQTITNLFNKQNPDIDVKLVFVGNGEQLDSKILAAETAHTLPTMAQVYPAWAGALVAKGVVTPVEDFPNFSKVTASIYQSVVNMGKINGKVYTLPFNQGIYILYYRPLMLAAAGINPPKTMSELARDAKLLTIKKGNKTVRYGLGFRTTYGLFTAVARQFGGAKYINSKGQFTINSPENLKALEFLVNLVKEGYAYAKYGYFDNELTTSSVAMLFGEGPDLPFDLSDISGQKDGIKMTEVPVGTSGKLAPLFRGQTITIFNTAPKAAQLAAWKYLQFLLSPAVQAYWAIKTNYSPLNKKVLNLTQWKNFVSQSPYNSSVIASGLANGISYSENLPYWPNIITTIQTAFQNAVHFSMTPQQALNWAQARATEIKNKYLNK